MPQIIQAESIAPPIESAEARAWSSYYDRLYEAAGERAEVIPWADLRANPALVNWLNAEAPQIVRPGGSVAVVGCGLGDDAAEIAARGYETVAFDVSRAAIDWASRRHPHVQFQVADLFGLPSRLQRRFDLVVECYTLQSLHPDLRVGAAAGVVALAKAHGSVMVIARGRGEVEDLPEAPPYPLTAQELTALFAPQGFRPMRDPDSFEDSAGVPRLRAVFQRR